METVTPTLGVVSRVTTVLATVRTWEGTPVTDTFAALLAALQTDDQRSQLPAALGEALITLRLDPERLRLAMDVIVEFDLYEACDGVVRLLRETRDPDIVVGGGRLSTHPGRHHFSLTMFRWSVGRRPRTRILDFGSWRSPGTPISCRPQTPSGWP